MTSDIVSRKYQTADVLLDPRVEQAFGHELHTLALSLLQVSCQAQIVHGRMSAACVIGSADFASLLMSAAVFFSLYF